MTYKFSNIQTQLTYEFIKADPHHMSTVKRILKYSPGNRIERNMRDFVKSLPEISGVNKMDIYMEEVIVALGLEFKVIPF